MKKKETSSVTRLLDIMDELREKCPWDREQTMNSLKTLTIEESYELLDAINEKDYVEIKNELGDLLLHIVFYTKIAIDTELFHRALAKPRIYKIRLKKTCNIRLALEWPPRRRKNIH